MRTPALILSLSWLILTGCAGSAQLGTPSEPTATAGTTMTTHAYLFQVADGVPAATAQHTLNGLLDRFNHSPPTSVGRRYLRVTFTTDPGLNTLQSAIQASRHQAENSAQTVIIAVQPEFRYTIDPPMQKP